MRLFCAGPQITIGLFLCVEQSMGIGQVLPRCQVGRQLLGQNRQSSQVVAREVVKPEGWVVGHRPSVDSLPPPGQAPVAQAVC